MLMMLLGLIIIQLCIAIRMNSRLQIVYELMLIPVGIFVLLRHRWAFITATVLSFNPVYYVANTIYIWKRWAEMGAPSQPSAVSAGLPRVAAQSATQIADAPAAPASGVFASWLIFIGQVSFPMRSFAPNEKTF
jgi:hypothetical protein